MRLLSIAISFEMNARLNQDTVRFEYRSTPGGIQDSNETLNFLTLKS